MFKKGLRVVRGKDWKYGNQDSGEGHVGTVIRLGTESSKIVKVCWDSGVVCDYRVGSEGAYDLRIFDNAPVGVKHPRVTCDGCQDGIIGFRFKCVTCEDFDFCTYCYMNTSPHILTHGFCRFDSSDYSIKQTLPLRSQSRKMIAKGIFPDAVVVRGKDWSHGNKYGDENCEGTVLKICSDKNFDRGAVEVGFSSGKTDIFSVGLMGKVELKYVKSSSNGTYYPDHLPRLVYAGNNLNAESWTSLDDRVLGQQFFQFLTEQRIRESYHMEFAAVTYKETMETVLANPQYIPVEQLHDHHERAIQTSLQAVNRLQAISEKLILKVREHVEPIYEDYKSINAKKNMSKAPAIGIDLGTTFCCVAYYNINGEVEVIPNSLSECTTPSYVQFNDDDIIVGETAKMLAYRNPEDTIFDVKRMCGRNFEDHKIQKLRKYWPFKVVEGEDGKIQIKVQNQYMLPEQVLTNLLADLKKSADEFLGDSVINAVVTVPAYFNARQRALTKEACHKAGLNILQFISEPAAAAVAYELHLRQEEGKKTCLIFDLGGGTFDVAVLELHKTKIMIKAIDGDPYLGGQDFDNLLVQYCLDEFKKEHGVDLTKVGTDLDKFRRLTRIKMECEKQKCYLSAQPKTVKISAEAINGQTPLLVPLTREKFSELIKPFVEKCMEAVDKVLTKCHLKESDVNDIVIVGGSTRIPYIQERLKQKFGGRQLLKKIKPEEVVARGAAILAYQFENPGLPNVTVRDLDLRPDRDIF